MKDAVLLLQGSVFGLVVRNVRRISKGLTLLIDKGLKWLYAYVAVNSLKDRVRKNISV